MSATNKQVIASGWISVVYMYVWTSVSPTWPTQLLQGDFFTSFVLVSQRVLRNSICCSRSVRAFYDEAQDRLRTILTDVLELICGNRLLVVVV